MAEPSIKKTFIELMKDIGLGKVSIDALVDFSATHEITDFSTFIPDGTPYKKCKETWLHVAAQYGNREAMEFITGKTRNLDIRDKNDGETALSSAIGKGNTETAGVLISAGASPNITDRDGVLPIHVAIMSGDIETFRILQSLSPIDLNKNTVGDEELLEELGQAPPFKEVERGRVVAGDGWNEPFEYENDDVEPERDEIPSSNHPDYKNYFPNGGENAVHFVLNTQDEAFLDTVIAHGGDINVPCETGEQPIHLAAKWHPSLVPAVIRHGGDPNAVSREGMTPLHYAITRRDTEAVRMLLDAGADPEKTKKNGSPMTTPVMLAKEGSEARSLLESFIQKRALFAKHDNHLAPTRGSI